jgi:hypothetical protein
MIHAVPPNEAMNAYLPDMAPNAVANVFGTTGVIVPRGCGQDHGVAAGSAAPNTDYRHWSAVTQLTRLPDHAQPAPCQSAHRVGHRAAIKQHIAMAIGQTGVAAAGPAAMADMDLAPDIKGENKDTDT